MNFFNVVVNLMLKNCYIIFGKDPPSELPVVLRHPAPA